MRFARATIVLALLLPVVALAQTSAQDSLRATIRTQLMADPRAAQMSAAQIDSMVNVLAAQAARQGVTAEQIQWRPYAPESVTAAPPAACAGYPAYFCSLTSALGFGGLDIFIPLALFAAAAGFLVIVALMRHHGHPHADFSTPASS